MGIFDILLTMIGLKENWPVDVNLSLYMKENWCFKFLHKNLQIVGCNILYIQTWGCFERKLKITSTAINSIPKDDFGSPRIADPYIVKDYIFIGIIIVQRDWIDGVSISG